jgi:hypothetical protein
MQKLCIFSLLISLFLITQFCSAGSDKDQDKIAAKTGDIEVIAHGSSPPPYENGILLTLNRMPTVNWNNLPEWIRNMPNDKDDLADWTRRYCDSINDNNADILYYIFDSLGLKINIDKPLARHIDYKVMEVTTDSLGRYLFIDIPIGYYQIMCTSDFVPESDRKADDCLKNETDDSTVEYFEIPELPEKIQHLGVIDNVRVAADSISVVEVKEYREPMPYEEWPSARDWIAKFKQKGGDNHDKP